MGMIRLDKYCESVRDGTHDTPKPTTEGKYLVTSKAINNDTIDYSSAYYISEKDFNIVNKRSKVDKYDVLMTMIGSVGRLHLVDYEPDYAIKNIALFKIGDYYKAKWLYYYMSSNNVQNYLEAVANGTSQHFVGLGYLRKFKIEDINEDKKRIVDILTNYDNLIKFNNKRIAILEQMAEEIYKEWFIRFRFPGYKSTEFENGIPKDWQIKRIKDYGKVITGKTPSTEKSEYYGDEYLFIKTPDMHDNYFVIETDEKLSIQGNNSQKKCKLPINSIMVSCIGTAGVVAINKKEGHTNQQINSIILDNEKHLNWLFFTVKSMKETINMYGNTGATMTNLSKGKFERLKLLQPAEELIIKFDKISNPIMDEIYYLQNINQNLIKQRDLLLPRLMSGKLEVK